VIGYRLLPPAEEEMTEASLFYEAARSGLGDLFLDDMQRAIDTIRERPHLGIAVAHGFRRALVRRFPFSLIYTRSRARKSSSLQWRISDADRTTGEAGYDC